MRLCRFDILCDGVLGGAPGAFHGGVLGGVPGGAPDGEDEQEGCGSCLWRDGVRRRRATQ